MTNAPALMKLRRAAPAATGFVHDHVSLVPENSLGIGKLQLVANDADRLFYQIAGRFPPRPRSMIAVRELEIAWLGPAEWLVTGLEAEVSDLLRHADGIARDLGHAVDLTHARASFLLTGPRARDRLAAVTPLDISRRAFAEGAVARAPLGDTTMFLARLTDLKASSRFRIIVDQTMASYAARMLAGPFTATSQRSS